MNRFLMANHLATRSKLSSTLNKFQRPTSYHMHTFDMIPDIGSRCVAHVALLTGVEDGQVCSLAICQLRLGLVVNLSSHLSQSGQNQELNMVKVKLKMTLGQTSTVGQVLYRSR